jgi:oligosaccharyltransferase complex subunit gamma
MIGAVLYVKRNNLEFLYNKTTWSIIVIVSIKMIFFLLFFNYIYLSFHFKGLILIFISGQMWNQIRNPPPVHRNPTTGQIVIQ